MDDHESLYTCTKSYVHFLLPLKGLGFRVYLGVMQLAFAAGGPQSNKEPNTGLVPGDSGPKQPTIGCTYTPKNSLSLQRLLKLREVQLPPVFFMSRGSVQGLGQSLRATRSPNRTSQPVLNNTGPV